MQPDPAALAEIAPEGALRVALNTGNYLLVSGRSPDGAPEGVAPSLAAALAGRIGLPLQFLEYASPGDLVDSAASGAWDVGFVGADPKRSDHLAFTEPYVEIEATFLVPAGSSARECADLDRVGTTIAAAERSAYHLWLEANFRRADLRPARGLNGSLGRFVDEGLDALAGLRPRLEQDAAELPGSRILPGRFMAVQQAVCTIRGRERGLKLLQEFVREMKATGAVARLINAHGQDRTLALAH